MEGLKAFMFWLAGVLALIAASLFNVHSTVALSVPASYDWRWRKGRVTYYGTDGWSIHEGSCNYGTLGKDEPLGWNAAAITDIHYEYTDSCGLCYEVKCDPTWINDAQGGSFDRSKACYDGQSSLILRVTDVCPCTYPPNQWSNRRWCCGDVDHFDISIWAFERLAETRWGVIPIQYRPVPCNYQPQREANKLNNPTPGWQPSWGSGGKPTRDWPEYIGSERKRYPTIAFDGGYGSGVRDVSWGNTWVQSLPQARTNGALSQTGLCSKIPVKGAVALKGWKGMFQGYVALEVWVYVGYMNYQGTQGMATNKPDIWFSISGSKGGCKPIRIHDLKPLYFQPKWVPWASDYYWGYNIYLPVFGGAWPQTVINKASDFQGCGGNSVYDLDTIEIRNDGWFDVGHACLDRIKLV